MRFGLVRVRTSAIRISEALLYYDYTGLLLTSLLLHVHVHVHALINQCKLCWNKVL